MARVLVKRQHHLDQQQVRKHMEELANDLATRLSAEFHWVDDERLEFKRSGAQGYVAQRPGEIEVFVQLGLLLAPWKGKVESVVSDYLDKTLA